MRRRPSAASSGGVSRTARASTGTFAPRESGWGPLNLLASAAASLIAASLVVTVVNAVRSRWKGAPAGADPWQADTLEWSTGSPPPPGNFAALPVVASREPLWDRAANPSFVTGLATDRREVLVTTLVEAVPDHRTSSAGPSWWPVLGAVAVIGSIFTPWGLPVGVVLAIPVMIGWFWPKGEPTERSAQQPGVAA